MHRLHKIITLQNGDSMILKAWGEINRVKYINILFSFILAMGAAAETGDPESELLGEAFEKLEKLIRLSVIDDGMLPDFDDMTFDEKLSIAWEMWYINGIGIGDGVKKILGLYKDLLMKKVEALQDVN